MRTILTAIIIPFFCVVAMLTPHYAAADCCSVQLPDKSFSVAVAQPVPPFSSAVERLLNYIEHHIIDAAEAMPENLFDFTPDSLHVAGSEFKTVRNFAGQIKHLATDNFAIWSPLTNDAMPPGIEDVNGPKDIRTKAEVIKFLKQSFLLGHKAIATLTQKNAMEMIDFRGSKLPRLDLAFYGLTHANEHYGQMVVYLRMCGIIPPASRR